MVYTILPFTFIGIDNLFVRPFTIPMKSGRMSRVELFVPLLSVSTLAPTLLVYFNKSIQSSTKPLWWSQVFTKFLNPSITSFTENISFLVTERIFVLTLSVSLGFYRWVQLLTGNWVYYLYSHLKYPFLSDRKGSVTNSRNVLIKVFRYVGDQLIKISRPRVWRVSLNSNLLSVVSEYIDHNPTGPGLRTEKVERSICWNLFTEVTKF